MKRTMTKMMIALVVVAMLAIPVFASAQGQGYGQRGQGRGHGHGPQMMEQRMNRLASVLNLTEAQQALFDEMIETHKTFMDAQRETCIANGQSPRRMMKNGRRAMGLFRDQVDSENPDFAAAAKTMKAEYTGGNVTEFNAMVDAKTAFYQSLTADQLEIMKEHHKNRPRGKRGRGPQPQLAD